MEPFDFCAVYHIIIEGSKQHAFKTQYAFFRQLFSSCIDQESYDNYDLSKSTASKYVNGTLQIRSDLLKYALLHPNYFRGDLQTFIVPALLNVPDTMEKLYELLRQDENIAINSKASVLEKYPCKTQEEYLDFFTSLMLFLFVCPFKKRCKKTSEEIQSELASEAEKEICDEALSPKDFLYDSDVPPSPCSHFCGREKELDKIQEAFSHYTTVSLSGIAGMGKSELAKAYCQVHANGYTNIIYLHYTGDLKRDIAELDFCTFVNDVRPRKLD